MDTWEKFIVINRKEYKNFPAMLEDAWIENVIPDKKEISEWVQVYYQFYTKEMEDVYWVVWIGLRLV